MNDDEKAKKLLDTQETQLREYLAFATKVHNSVPAVNDALQNVMWQRQAFQTMPNSHSLNLEAADLRRKEEIVAFTEDSLRSLRNFSPTSVSSLSALTVGETSATYALVVKAEASSDPNVKRWAIQNENSYRALHETQQRPAITKERLLGISRHVAAEFEEAINDVKRAVTTTADIVGAGIKLRNVLEHVKGELFEKAIRRPHEQQIKWPAMAGRLALNGENSTQCHQLLPLCQDSCRLDSSVT